MTDPHRPPGEPRLTPADDSSESAPKHEHDGLSGLRRTARSSVLDSQRRVAEAAHDIDVSLSRTKWVWPAASALVVLVILGAGVFFAFQWGFGTVDDGDLPLVSAQAEPIKSKPESPGGLEVPHQDVLVLNQESGEPAVERLLPPPETPEPPAAEPQPYVPAPETGEATTSVLGAVPEAPAEAIETEGQITITEAPKPALPEPPAAEAPNTESLVVEAPEVETPKVEAPQVAEAPEVETPKVTEAPKAVEAPKTESPKAEPAAKQVAALPDPKKGDHLLQLAAFTDKSGTEVAWTKLQKKFPDLLGDMGLFVQKAVVNGKTYYRLQTGPFPNRATALDLCAQLKARKQDCLVVRR